MNDVLIYHQYRTLHGSIRTIDVYRRNGRSAASFGPLDVEDPAARTLDVFTLYRDTLAANLTPVEERTWRRLLNGRSVAAIAEEDGVKRPAIYARIRGSRGRGGMVRKNAWVAHWWQRRQHQRP